MKKKFHDLKAGDVFQMEHVLSKDKFNTYLRTNAGVVNMETWLHVDTHKVREYISLGVEVIYVGNLTMPRLGKAFDLVSKDG